MEKIREALEYFDDDVNEHCDCRRCESIRAIRLLKAALPALVKAAEKFVDKCETGKAYSKESYREFKEALSLLAEKKP